MGEVVLDSELHIQIDRPTQVDWKHIKYNLCWHDERFSLLKFHVEDNEVVCFITEHTMQGAEGPYYTQLGAGASVEDIRQLLESR